LSGFQFGSAKGDNSKNLINENNKRNLNVMDTMAPSKKLKASEEKV
jgi:hypothetical protein